MASGVDLGTAWIQIAPSMKGFKREVSSQMGDLGAGASSKTAGQKIMSGVGGALKTVGKIGVGTMAGLGTAVAGIAMHGGISRALAIENAQAKLVGLGHDTKGVQAIMDSALASVKGTAYGLGDAATVAASLSATGLQAGKDLDGALKSVADVSQITGRSLTDVGAIFGSIAARGKLQGDDMLQLMSSGLPVLQMLGEELGVTSEQVSEMVSRGEIDFATFQRAMERGVGGAALAAGETFQGAWANMKAALGRVGAEAVTPVLNSLRDSFNQLIPVVDSLGVALGPVFETVGEKIGVAAAAAVGFITSLVDGSSGVDLSWVSTLASGIWELAKGALAVLVPMLETVWNTIAFFAPIVASLVGTIAGVVGQILQLNGVGEVLTGVVLALVAGFGLWKAVTLAQQAATAIATGAQVLFNAVMAANPIMLLVVAIGALVAALVYFFTQTELGRQVWQTLVDAFHSFVSWIGGVWSSVWQFLSDAWTTFSTWFSETWNAIWTAIGPVVTAAWNGVTSVVSAGIRLILAVLRPALGTIKAVWQVAWDLIATIVPPVWRIITTIISVAIRKVWAVISTVLTTIKTVWSVIWNVIAAVIRPIWTVISTVISTYITIVSTIISTVLNFISAIWETGWTLVSTFVGAVWDGIVFLISAAVNGIADLITGALNVVATIWETVWSGISLFVTTIWGLINAVIVGYIELVKSVISTGLGFIRSVWNTVWGAISGFVSTVWAAISGTVTAGINAVRSFVQAGMSLVSSLWSAAWNSVASFVTGAWSRIKSGVSSGVSGMLGIVRSIPGQILSALGNMGSLLYNAGASVIQGFINGITSMIGRVRDTLSSLTSMLPSWKGPAKVDARILYGSGELVMTGFKRGLEDQYAGVKRTLQGFTNDLAMSPATVAVNTAGSVTPTGLAQATPTESGGFTRGQPVNLVLRTLAGDVKLAVAAEIEEVLGAGGSARAEFGVA